MPQEDYLKLTLENILNQLSEVKDMISDSTKINSEFKDTNKCQNPKPRDKGKYLRNTIN